MLIVEIIAKIRRLFREHRSIREISRELRLSRKVVRKALRSDKTAFAYKRQHQPRPQLDGRSSSSEPLPAISSGPPLRPRSRGPDLRELRCASAVRHPAGRAPP